MAQKPKRLAALDVAKSQLGVRETAPNWGPQVKMYLASTGISTPAPWCMAFLHWSFLQVGVTLGGGASVGNFQAWAAQNGELVRRPFKGDAVCFDWNSDAWPDHVGIVERVLALRWKGKVFAGWIQTIEGNTSSGTGGSQSDGDGVYRRRRWVTSCKFCRVKG